MPKHSAGTSRPCLPRFRYCNLLSFRYRAAPVSTLFSRISTLILSPTCNLNLLWVATILQWSPRKFRFTSEYPRVCREARSKSTKGRRTPRDCRAGDNLIVLRAQKNRMLSVASLVQLRCRMMEYGVPFLFHRASRSRGLAGNTGDLAESPCLSITSPQIITYFFCSA